MDIFEKATSESRGREAEILSTLGRISGELLDGRHYPCPKCGGDDRFRFNQDKGSCFCNQCFKTSKADVVSSLAWLIDIKRNEAAGMILDHLGVKYKKTKHWKDFLEISQWKPNFDLVAATWSEAKGVTVEAMHAAGVTWARHKHNGGILAFPIYGEGLKICGYSMYSRAPKGTLAKWVGKDKPPQQLKVKACDGSKQGMLGQVKEVEAAGVVAICEGGTDMLAAITAFRDQPRPVATVSPSNGAGQKLPQWFIAMLAGKDVMVIPDRDVPGEAAGKAWCQQVAAVTDQVKLVELPYDLAETHGKDLRDFLAEHPGDLETIIENSGTFAPKTEADGTVAEAELVEDDEKAYRELKIDVVSRLNSNGAVLYCRKSKVTQELPSIDKLTLPTLITLCGSFATNYVKDKGESADYKISVNQVQKLLAADISKSSEDVRVCGSGLWQADDGTVVLVNGTHVLLLNGRCEKTEDGVYRNLRFQYDRCDWFDAELFQRHYEAAKDPEWRAEVVREFYTFIDRWTWEHDNCRWLVAGLVLATMAQAVIQWRPLVSIIGGTNTGKTVLGFFLGGLFGKHFVGYTDDATKAGLLNNLKNKSPFVIHDEWDNASATNRRGILQMVRSSSRLSSTGIQKQVFRSDTHQRGIKSDFLPIMLWLIGINNDIEFAPDRNRTIEIRLKEPQSGGEKDVYFREHGITQICEKGKYSAEIGLKLLAIVARTLPSALRLYVPASIARLDDIPSRVVESWAVPASFLIAAWGHGEDHLEFILDKFRDIYWNDESIDVKTDADEIFENLFSLTVILESNQRKVLSEILQNSQSIEQHRETIESCGITFLDHEGEKYLFVNGRSFRNKKITDKTERSITQILGRIPGAKTGHRHHLNAARLRGTLVPLSHIRRFIPNICWHPRSVY